MIPSIILGSSVLALYYYKTQLSKATKKNVSFSETVSVLYNYLSTRINMKIYGTTEEQGIKYAKYYHNSTMYKVPIVVKRGPKIDIEKVVHVHNDEREHGEDVTLKILHYAGPNKDFHNMNITPKMLGYKVLIFTIDGEEKTIEENEVIKIE